MRRWMIAVAALCACRISAEQFRGVDDGGAGDAGSASDGAIADAPPPMPLAHGYLILTTNTLRLDKDGSGELSFADAAPELETTNATMAAISPHGLRLYVSDVTSGGGGSGIIDDVARGSGGQLGSNHVVGQNCLGPAVLALAPDGSRLAAICQGPAIQTFAIGPDDLLDPEQLFLLPGEPAPVALAWTPDSHCLFVQDASEGELYAYQAVPNGLTSTTGTPNQPTQFSGPPASAVGLGVAVARDGSVLYVAADDIEWFGIGSDCSLSASRGMVAATSPDSLYVDPEGTHLYALFSDPPSHGLDSFQIGSDGSLVRVTGAPYALQTRGFDVEADPTDPGLIYIGTSVGSGSGGSGSGGVVTAEVSDGALGTMTTTGAPAGTMGGVRWFELAP